MAPIGAALFGARLRRARAGRAADRPGAGAAIEDPVDHRRDVKRDHLRKQQPADDGQAQRLALYRRTVPHEGFALLRRWAASTTHGAFVFTSNVDGQFQRAGIAEERIAEVHGSLHHLQCLEACCDALWRADGFEPVVDESECRIRSPLPRCPRCGALARPNVMMFGDADWIGARSEDQQAKLRNWLGVRNRAVAIELGAGSTIPTVRWFTEHCGLPYIRINPTEPEVPSRRGIGIRAGALAALRAIDALPAEAA